MTMKRSMRQTQNAAEFAVCMGMDAFRLCIGLKPRNFTRDDVVRWLTAINAEPK